MGHHRVDRSLHRPSWLIAGALALWVVPPVFAQCPELQLRVWSPGGQEVWAKSPEGVTLTSGREAHVYLHVESRSRLPYGTSARIGYPSDFGGSERQRDVARHVQMTAPTAEDVRNGRIRLRAGEPGSTRLGYEVSGVNPPGSLDALSPGCRRGLFDVVVRAEEPTDPAPAPTPEQPTEPGASTPPAQRLVAMLYEAILRRDAGTVDRGFVETVRRRGRDGLLEVAASIAASDEFRREALRRTEEVPGRRGWELPRLREALLQDIYKDLYGYLEPDPRDRDADLAALDVCLSGSRDARRACEDFGRDLVASRLFADAHRDVLRQLVRRD